MTSLVKIVRIEGVSDLMEALDELPKATSTNVQKRALMKAGQPIADSASAGAPVLSGKLRESVIVSTRLSPAQRSSLDKESKVEVYIGPGPLVEAITSEFGTYRQSPRPFLRPAWSQHKQDALDIIRDELANEIEKARKRIARKAERLAAQMGRS